MSLGLLLTSIQNKILKITDKNSLEKINYLVVICFILIYVSVFEIKGNKNEVFLHIS
jgi:cytosine/uracil/thiamine/allantoin permease